MLVAATAALSLGSALLGSRVALGRPSHEPADWAGPSVFEHGSLTLTVSGAVLSEDSGNTFDVWANSPEAQVTVTNKAAGFYHGKLRWHNVPAGSYLESGRRVAEAATATGRTLTASLTLAGGGRANFRLQPNFRKVVHFAIVASAGQAEAARRSGLAPQFAIELGGLGLAAASDVSGLGFPVYLMPGLHDHASLVRKRIGGGYGYFAIGTDRVLLLDDREHRLGERQLDWLGHELAAFRDEGVQQVLVCFQIAPFDPRLHHRDGLDDRVESRRIAHLFRTAHIAALVAPTGDRDYVRTWYGFKEFCLSNREAAIVDAESGNFSIRVAHE